MKTMIRKSQERGKVEAGWLKSMHSFSFGSYHDEDHMGFGPLRVINEDWIGEGSGFGMHPHEDMEIMTILLEGELEHKDSLGTKGLLKPGEVQLMSAGVGIVHSEFNHSKEDSLHLYQIWIEPSEKGLEPKYQQKDFSKELENSRWTLLASSEASNGELKIHQDAQIWRLQTEDQSAYGGQVLKAKKVWVQVLKGSVLVSNNELNQGDAFGVEEISEYDLSEIKINDQSGLQTDVMVFIFN